MVIEKCTDVFREIFFCFFFFGGGGVVEGVVWEDLSMEEFVMGEQNFNELGTGFSCII